MTPIEAIQAGDRDAALAALADMSPKERRKQATEIIKIYKTWQEGDFGPVPGKPNTSRWFYSQGSDEQREAAQACVVVLATASEFVRDSQMPWLTGPDVVVHAAKQVAPPWLNEPDMEALARAGKLSWRTVEGLVAAGLCARPTSDPFIESMIEGTGFRSDKPLVDLLRDTPGLIEQGTLYRVFAVEGGQQSSLSAADKYRRDQNQWATALAELSATGELDRGRLIDGCLDALARDFAAFRAGWFSRFHDRLAPTDPERTERSDAYLRLLGSSIPATVSFAVNSAAKLHKLKAVAAEELLRALPPALQARQKGTVKRAAKLLHAAAKKVPTAVPEAIDITIDALVHPDVDVQSALLDVVDKLLPLAGEQADRFKERLAECRDIVAPSLQNRLPGSAAPGQSEPTALPIPERLAPLADSLRVPYAETIEQALDLVAYALEHEDDPIAQEVALDAIARYADPPDGWSTLCGPVRKRALALWKRDSTAEHVLQLALTYLALAWTCGEKPEWQRTYADGKRDFDIYLGRIEHLADRVVQRQSLPLLSTPTHQGGFIEGGAFRDRLGQWSASGAPLDAHDAVLALMRLPAQEAEAARHAIDLKLKNTLELAASPPRCQYGFRVSSRTSGDYTFHSVEVEPSFPIPEPKSCLELRHALRGAKLHSLVGDSIYGDVPITLWLATVSPGDLSDHFANGVRDLGKYNMDNPLANGHFLAAARSSWVELGDSGHCLLMLCLASRGSRAIEVALDVAIDGVEQGRVRPDKLGHVLATLMPSGILKAKRVATTLSQIAATSPRHADFVISAIAGGLRGNPADAPRDIGALLSVLHELLIAQRARLEDDEARAWLQAQKRGGQVAKFRKALLAL